MYNYYNLLSVNVAACALLEAYFELSSAKGPNNNSCTISYSIHSKGVHLSCADLLIREGANLDKQTSDGSTAMHLASAIGAVSLVELMLLNNASPDIRDFEGRLPIHWATLPRSSKCAIVLLKVGIMECAVVT